MSNYKAIFSSIPLPAVLLSDEGFMLEANDSAKAVFAQTDDQRSMPQIMHEWIGDTVANFMSTNDSCTKFERTLERPGLGTRYFNVNLARINAQGRDAKALAICSDISERFRNQEMIDLQMDIINSSNDAMLSLSLDGTIFFANNSAATLYGYSTRELRNHSIYDLTPARLKSEMQKILAEMRDCCRVVRMETLRRNRQGYVFPVSDSYSPIVSNGVVNAVSLISRDISERKESERALNRSHAKLKNILNETVNALSMTLEKRDMYTAGHQQKVACISYAIGEELGLDPAILHSIHIAGVLHDIGKICIPMAILSKPAKLSVSEMGLVRNHPQNGLDIIKSIPFPYPIGKFIHQHHERMDGSGYPEGLKGDAITMGARIIAVADVLEAMVAHRPYRPALGIEAALNELELHKGVKYDLTVYEALLRAIDKGVIIAKKGELILCQSK